MSLWTYNYFTFSRNFNHILSKDKAIATNFRKNIDERELTGPFPAVRGLAYPNLTNVWGNVSTFSNHVNDRAIVSSGKELSNGMEVLQWIQ